MLNYEEELKKFKPCLDVDEVEDAIYSRDLTDVIDILKEMMKTTSRNRKTRQKRKGRVRCRNELYEL